MVLLSATSLLLESTLTGSPYGGQIAPIGVAIDNTGNIWVANSDNDVQAPETSPNSLLPSSPEKPTPHRSSNTGTGNYPFDVAIDGSGNVWVDEIAGVTGVLQHRHPSITPRGFPQNATTAPESITIDGLGRAWVSNVALDASLAILPMPGYGSVTVFSPTGTLINSNVSTPVTGAPSFLGYTAAGTISQRSPCSRHEDRPLRQPLDSRRQPTRQTSGRHRAHRHSRPRHHAALRRSLHREIRHPPLRQHATRIVSEDIMKSRNSLLISVFALFFAFALPLDAQTGCDKSPENPTLILAVIGSAAGFFVSARARRKARRDSK